MARPKRNNADYFSHDTGMRNDPKIKALRNKFGCTGYSVYCMMLEVLTGSDFFKRKIDDIEIEILSADFGIEADLFSEILQYMLRLRLLQSGDNCEFLSQKLTDRLQPVIDKRSNSRKKVVSVTESTQSKVKESKVKKSKDNKTKEQNEKLEIDFEIFWNDYPKKKEKQKAKATLSKYIKLGVGIEKICEAMNKDEALRNEYQFIPYPSTWLNKTPWLDEEFKPMKDKEMSKEERQAEWARKHT
jgi:hypothetical protein